MHRRSTIRDIAELSGVSITTVSHVLTDSPGKRVAPDTRARVRSAAEQLNYTPNRLAQGLRLQRSKTIGVISDLVLTTPYATEMILGAQDAAAAADYLLVLVSSGGEVALESREARALMDRRVDGLVYASMYHRIVEPPKELLVYPAVLLDGRSADGSIASVVPDEVGGARAAMAELISHGHRRIGWICDSHDVLASHGRTTGYRSALTDAGIPVDESLVYRLEADTQNTYALARRILADPHRPTALFCFNDRAAMGVYFAAHDVGLSIPRDLSVVGFDDQRLISTGVRPELTTVALPHYDMGHWAITHLLTVVDSGDRRAAADPPHVTLPCPLIRRESVSSPSRD
jgi:LacI family transcriptional regulator